MICFYFQVEHLQREISLLWEIIRDLMILFGPMVIGWMGYFLSRMLFSRMWEVNNNYNKICNVAMVIVFLPGLSGQASYCHILTSVVLIITLSHFHLLLCNQPFKIKMHGRYFKMEVKLDIAVVQ